jgi:hypothetical protein
MHEDIYDKKHPGTGDWLLQRTDFLAWFDSPDSALLWCYGKRKFLNRQLRAPADVRKLARVSPYSREFFHE